MNSRRRPDFRKNQPKETPSPGGPYSVREAFLGRIARGNSDSGPAVNSIDGTIIPEASWHHAQLQKESDSC
jgi:hypothetical protein